jgi:hypothetical protein
VRGHGRAGQESDRLVRIAQAAADRTPPGHPDRAGRLSDLCGALLARFDRSGDLADASSAIRAGRAAVADARPDDRDRARYLSNLGGALRARFERAGELADLNEAIRAVRDAITAGDGHPERVTFVHNLGLLLHARFLRTKRLADLTEAIGAARAVAAVTRAGDPRYAEYQCVLGVDLWQRFQESGNPADLNEAIEAGRAAVRAAAVGHPRRALFLHDLCNMLLSRLFSAGGPTMSRADLREVITTAQAAVDATPAGHPNLVGYLFNLGTGLWARSGVTGNPRDAAGAFAAWRQATRVQAGPAARRLSVARAWGQFAADRGMMPEAEAGLTAAVELLPLQAWHGLRQHTRQNFLAGRAGLASDAAACAISARHPEHAVELLEQGRAVLWSQALLLRGDLDDLRSEHSDLADRLDAARAILDHPGQDSGDLPPGAPSSPMPGHASRRDEDEARQRAADSWDKLITEVRALPEFTSFLRPPALAELITGMSAGTVVILNVSQYRCDALAVSRAGVRVIPLPALTLSEASDEAGRYRTALAELGRLAAGPPGSNTAAAHQAQQRAALAATEGALAWLWDAVTGPVLDALGHTAAPGTDLSSWPRVWWCPTGPLTALPLHAAGHHTSGQPGSAVLDRVVSSYTSTLQALHRARQGGRPAARQPGPRMLLVTMPATPYLPGGAPLPGVTDEARRIAQRFPLTLTHLTGKSATTDAVLSGLQAGAYAHFACHGTIDLRQPAESGLCLTDGRLTIEAISRRGLPPEAAQLAFLSACHTAAASPALPDESITVAAALQLAGFRHIVATLWAIADTIAPQVADDVYGALTGHPQPALGDELPIAHALHSAITRLRTAGYHPVQWAPYTHTGP